MANRYMGQMGMEGLGQLIIEMWVGEEGSGGCV